MPSAHSVRIDLESYSGRRAVRLAIFAEMSTGKPRTLAFLNEVGGTEVSLLFIE